MPAVTCVAIWLKKDILKDSTPASKASGTVCGCYERCSYEPTKRCVASVHSIAVVRSVIGRLTISQRAQISMPSASMVVCMRCTSSLLKRAWQALPWRSKAGQMPAWPDCIIAVCHHCLHDFKRNKKEAKDLKPFSSVRSPLSVKIALNFIHHCAVPSLMCSPCHCRR